MIQKTFVGEAESTPSTNQKDAFRLPCFLLVILLMDRVLYEVYQNALQI